MELFQQVSEERETTQKELVSDHTLIYNTYQYIQVETDTCNNGYEMVEATMLPGRAQVCFQFTDCKRVHW